MEQWVAILVVAAMVVLIGLLSALRKKRLQPTLDEFAKCFCALSDHLLKGDAPYGKLKTEPSEGDMRRMLPMQQQSEAIRRLFEQGVDDYAIAQMQKLSALREEARAHLSTFNLIGNRINGVLDRVYGLTSTFLSVLQEPSRLLRAEEEEDFDFFLGRQAFIRSTTLSAVVSNACKQDIVETPKK